MIARRSCMALLALPLAACSPQQAVLRRVADGLAAGAGGDEEDLELARDAAPVWLKTSEAVLAEVPGHVKLAEAVAANFTQYAYAFVASEAERVQAQDARAAARLRERAARLYRRANRHALRALELQQPGITPSLDRAGPALPTELVGLGYWGAASWGAWIAASKDAPDVVADLPRAVELARRAWLAAPDYGSGDLSALMGTFEASRPGGSRAQAEDYFARALATGRGNAGVHVAIAESLALPAADRPRFEQALHAAVAAARARDDLASRVMRERAERLLAGADDLF